MTLTRLGIGDHLGNIWALAVWASAIGALAIILLHLGIGGGHIVMIWVKAIVTTTARYASRMDRKRRAHALNLLCRHFLALNDHSSFGTPAMSLWRTTRQLGTTLNLRRPLDIPTYVSQPGQRTLRAYP
jgi:hypothetical protein